MNLDLLKKLTRLANNNPNENEANLAARRVCKMLQEGNWSLPVALPKAPQSAPRTWNDVTRTTEPEFRSKPPTGAGHNPFTGGFNPSQAQQEYYRKMYEEVYRNQTYSPFNDIQDEVRRRRGYNPRGDKQNKKCSKCGHVKQTTFMGPEERFICSDCNWTGF